MCSLNIMAATTSAAAVRMNVRAPRVGRQTQRAAALQTSSKKSAARVARGVSVKASASGWDSIMPEERAIYDTVTRAGAGPVVPRLDAGDPFGLLLRQRIVFLGSQVREMAAEQRTFLLLLFHTATFIVVAFPHSISCAQTAQTRSALGLVFFLIDVRSHTTRVRLSAVALSPSVSVRAWYPATRQWQITPPGWKSPPCSFAGLCVGGVCADFRISRLLAAARSTTSRLTPSSVSSSFSTSRTRQRYELHPRT